MKPETVCALVIRRAEGERVEAVEVHIREGEDLIVLRALDHVRRQMLGFTTHTGAPPIEIKTVPAA